MAQIQTLCLLPATVVLAAAAVALAGSDTEKGGGNEGCEHFDLDSIGGDWPSIAVIIARGRLGNHLVKYLQRNRLRFRIYFLKKIVDCVHPDRRPGKRVGLQALHHGGDGRVSNYITFSHEISSEIVAIFNYPVHSTTFVFQSSGSSPPTSPTWTRPSRSWRGPSATTMLV